MMYKSKGPFVVMSSLNNGSYMLQRWNKPDSVLLKYHSSDMYLLPAGLQPSDPLDTPDLRYINNSHGIIVHPLQPNLDITMFNKEWFEGHLPTDEPQYVPIPVSMRLEGPSHQWNNMDQDNALPQVAVEQMATSAEDTDEAEDLYEQIHASRDKFFFISYAAEQTFCPNWYLVCVYAEQRDSSPSWICTTYTVDFYAKDPNDAALADPDSRWWPEWHEYIIAADGVPEFRRRVLLTHSAQPNPEKFALYYDNVDLASASRLLGTFDFAQTLTRARQIVNTEIWASLCDQCMGRGIVPPKMNTRTRERGFTSSVFQATKEQQVNKKHNNGCQTPPQDDVKKMKSTPIITPQPTEDTRAETN
jgi:hypothetical protein